MLHHTEKVFFCSQEEYRSEHPRGINPVQLNDVIFTVHAVFVTIVTISQCFIYDVSVFTPSLNQVDSMSVDIPQRIQNAEQRLFIVYVCGHRDWPIDCIKLQHDM